MTILQTLLAEYMAVHFQSVDDDARAHLAGFVAFASPHVTGAESEANPEGPGDNGSPMDMPILVTTGEAAENLLPMDSPALAVAGTGAEAGGEADANLMPMESPSLSTAGPGAATGDAPEANLLPMASPSLAVAPVEGAGQESAAPAEQGAAQSSADKQAE